MKLFQKTGLILLLALFIGTLLLTGFIFAKDLAPTKGKASVNPKYGEGSINEEVTIQSTQYLQEGTNYIQLVSEDTVEVGGKTVAYSPVDEISVDLFLQIWDSSNGKWVDIVHVGEFTLNNSSIVEGSKNVIVVKGYYYRTHSKHTAISDGITEQKTAFSDYIYVN